jgi:hypothetical protein
MDYARNTEVFLEDTIEAAVKIKGDVGDRVVIFDPKFFHQPGLANLPRPVKNQGFTVWRILPFFQSFNGRTGHT